jgi:DNA-binding response OmpR family regulator
VAIQRAESQGNTALIKVLVILKEPEMGDLIRLILGRRGAAVHTELFELGLDCIESAVAVAEKDPPDLVLLDSEFLSDEQYYRLRASQALQQAPILFVDAKPHKMVDEQAKRLGARGYVLMPFSPQELLTAYEAVLHGETYYPIVPGET